MTYISLVAELKLTVVSLSAEAKRGDEQARRWCIEAFPAHRNFLLAVWRQADKWRREDMLQEEINHDHN